MTYEIPILNNLAQVYMKQKLYNKAMLILIKALIKAKQSSVQNYFGTLINLSSAASSLGIHTEAIIYLQKALKLIEGTADINLKVLCKYNIAIQYANIYKYFEAENTLKECLLIANENQITDLVLYSLITKALNFFSAVKAKDFEKLKSKTSESITKKILKKNFSTSEISSLVNSTFQKAKKVEKIVCKISSRNFNSAGRKCEKNESNTSSSESFKSCSNILKKSASVYKTKKKVLSEKTSDHSTPVSNASLLFINLPETEFGNRIQNIGDHLNIIERKLNDFAELCQPLKILTEDPDEQLDSHRMARYPC